MNAASDNTSQYILITPQGKTMHYLLILIHINFSIFIIFNRCKQHGTRAFYPCPQNG